MRFHVLHPHHALSQLAYLISPIKIFRTVSPRTVHCTTVLQACLASADVPQSTMWKKSPFYRYKQIWHQQVINGVLCRQYTPSPMHQMVTLPILPRSLQKDALIHNHDVPTAGHLEAEKTLERLHGNAFGQRC